MADLEFQMSKIRLVAILIFSLVVLFRCLHVIAEARGIGTMQEKTGSASSGNNLFEAIIEY